MPSTVDLRAASEMEHFSPLYTFTSYEMCVVSFNVTWSYTRAQSSDKNARLQHIRAPHKTPLMWQSCSLLFENRFVGRLSLFIIPLWTDTQCTFCFLYSCVLCRHVAGCVRAWTQINFQSKWIYPEVKSTSFYSNFLRTVYMETHMHTHNTQNNCPRYNIIWNIFRSIEMWINDIVDLLFYRSLSLSNGKTDQEIQ